MLPFPSISSFNLCILSFCYNNICIIFVNRLLITISICNNST